MPSKKDKDKELRAKLKHHKPHKKPKKVKRITRKRCLELLDVEIAKAKQEQTKQREFGDEQDHAMAVGFHAGLMTARGLVKWMFE
jgi:hypothetical protein